MSDEEYAVEYRRLFGRPPPPSEAETLAAARANFNLSTRHAGKQFKKRIDRDRARNKVARRSRQKNRR